MFLRRLVLGILCGWLSGMQVGVSQKHRCFSRRWAHIRPKHVEIDKYTKNKFVHQVFFYLQAHKEKQVNKT